jgi:hypothetical protein
MMLELWTRKRDMGDEAQNDVDDRSGYEKSEVELGRWSCEDLVSVLLHAASGLIPVVSGKVQFTYTRDSLKSQFVMVISVIFS